MNGQRLGHAEGADFRDFCKDPACPCCQLWPAPGDEWKARLRRVFAAAPLHTDEWRKERVS